MTKRSTRRKIQQLVELAVDVTPVEGGDSELVPVDVVDVFKLVATKRISLLSKQMTGFRRQRRRRLLNSASLAFDLLSTAYVATPDNRLIAQHVYNDCFAGVNLDRNTQLATWYAIGEAVGETRVEEAKKVIAEIEEGERDTVSAKFDETLYAGRDAKATIRIYSGFRMLEKINFLQATVFNLRKYAGREDPEILGVTDLETERDVDRVFQLAANEIALS